MEIPACSAIGDAVVSEDRRLAKGYAPQGDDHRTPHRIHKGGTPQAQHETLAIPDAGNLTGPIEDEVCIARHLLPGPTGSTEHRTRTVARMQPTEGVTASRKSTCLLPTSLWIGCTRSGVDTDLRFAVMARSSKVCLRLEDAWWRRIAVTGCLVGGLLPVAVASASWRAAEPVALLSGRAGLSPGAIHVAEDARGDAAVAWSQGAPHGSNRDEAVVVTRETGGAWSPPVRLSTLRASASIPRAVITATGETTVAWSELDRSRGWARIRVLVRSRRAGRWRPPHLIATVKEKAEKAPTFAPEAVVALNAREVPAVLFPVGRRATDEAVEIDRRPQDGRWPRPRVVAHTTYCLGTSLAFDRAGEPLLAWTRGNPISPGSLTRVEALTLKPNLRLQSKPTALSPAGRFAYAPEIAANARGDAAIVWALEGHESQPSNAPLEAAGRTPGHRFTRIPGQRLVAREGTPGGVAVDPDGTATVVFSTNIAEASTRTLAGKWSVPVPLSTTPAAEVVLAQDASDDLLAAWRTELPAEQGKTQRSFAIEASMRTRDGRWQSGSIISPPHSRAGAVSFAASNRALVAWENESTHRLEAAQLSP
jgi:hypothetical protein